MNRFKIKFSLFSLVLISSVFLSNQTTGQELNFKVLKSQKDWETAREDAKNSGKDIFLDIYASWCGPCKMMDANVYTVAAVSDYFNSNYVNLKVDGESEFGLVLASQYKISAYPSMYFINPGEELLYELIGYRDPEALVISGKQVKESGKRYQELNALYKTSTLSSAETDEYIDLLIKFGQKELLGKLAVEKIKSFSEADILNPANKAILLASRGDLGSFAVRTAMQNAAILDSVWGKQDFNQFLSDAFDITMQKAAELKDSVLMEKIAEELVPVYLKGNPDRIPEAKLTTRKIYYSEIQDWDNYVKTIEKHYDDFEAGNLRFLYKEAYYIVENQFFNPTMLDKSTEWLEKVIAIQPDFDTYFLTAIINTYKEDFDAARIWMNKAESVAVTEDEMDSLKELKKYLEEK